MIEWVFALVEIGILLISSVIAFIITYFYWVDLDRRAEIFDAECIEVIEGNRLFRGVSDNPRSEIVVTSDTKLSRLRTLYKRELEKPDKILPLEDESLEKRKEIVISERAGDVLPGKSIMQSELYFGLKYYICWRLAIATEGVSSEMVQNFESRMDEFEYSDRIRLLSQEDNINQICLIHNDDSLNPLDDVFLPLVTRVEKYNIQSTENHEKPEEEIHRCRQFIMLTFWGLYRGKLKGVLYDEETDSNECENKCRQDIREENNVGYWLLTKEKCDEELFKEFRHLGWKFKEIIDEYWNTDNCEELYPPAEKITQIPIVEEPYFLFYKEKSEFGPTEPKRKRKSGDPRFRKKETYT